MNSHWGGDIDEAFFSCRIFDKHRVLQKAEYSYNGRTNDNGYYVLGVDVGRHGCMTEIVVIKVTPVAKGNPLKQIVNIFTIDAEHFETQAIKIKQIFNMFKCKAAVIDGNGLGTGLIDYLVKDQVDPDTNEMLWNFGVINDEIDQNTGKYRYRQYETPDTIYDAMYIMKANIPLNSEMYSYCQTQMQSGRLKFLINDAEAKIKLMDMQKGKNMTVMERNEYLMPYVQTNILREQLANLVQEGNAANGNINLKPYNKTIKHDKVSALIYGLYYCKMQDDKNKKKSARDLSKLMLFSKGAR